MNKNQKSHNEIFEAVDAKHVARIAGAGNKMVYMLDQKADLYVNLVPGMKFWDMCASEALIQSMMGIVVSADNKPLIYDPDLEDYTVNEGIVIAKNKKVFDTACNRIKEATGHDMKYFQEKTQIETAEYRAAKDLKAAVTANV